MVGGEPLGVEDPCSRRLAEPVVIGPTWRRQAGYNFHKAPLGRPSAGCDPARADALAVGSHMPGSSADCVVLVERNIVVAVEQREAAHARSNSTSGFRSPLPGASAVALGAQPLQRGAVVAETVLAAERLRRIGHVGNQAAPQSHCDEHTTGMVASLLQMHARAMRAAL